MGISDPDWESNAFRAREPYARAFWRLRFMWRPRRSALTGRWLWLRRVYEGTAMWTGPGETVVEFRYHEHVEHVIWSLKL